MTTESGHPFNVAPERLRLTQGNVPVTALGHWDLLRLGGKSSPLLALQLHLQQHLVSHPRTYPAQRQTSQQWDAGWNTAAVCRGKWNLVKLFPIPFCATKCLQIQCFQKVFRPLDFFHILLLYILILKLIKLKYSVSYTQYFLHFTR